MLRARFRSLTRGFFTLPADSPADPQVARHFRHNVLVNVADTTAWLYGFSFLSDTTILPVYASTLTHSTLVIALIPALLGAGWFLPQLFLVPFVERLPRRLPVIARLSFVERLPFLGLVLLAACQMGLPRQTVVAIFLGLIVLRALSSGLVALPYQELMATVIPVSHRGRFFGTAHFVGGLAGIVGAAIAARILASWPYPSNFALSFLAGFSGIAASYLFLVMNIEPERATSRAIGAGTRSTAKRLIQIMRQNANLRAYLSSRAFAYLGNMATGFLAVYGIQRFSLPTAYAAIFTVLLLGSNMVGFALWGSVGDRAGNKRLMEINSLLWIGTLGAALAAPSVWLFDVVFVLMGLSSGGGTMADFNIALEFGSEEDRPAYIGLTRAVTGPVLLIAPLIGAWLVGIAGYPAMFAIALACSVVGLILLWWRVADPRHISSMKEMT